VQCHAGKEEAMPNPAKQSIATASIERAPGGSSAALSTSERARRRPFRQRLQDDWRGARYLSFGLVLLLCSSFIVTAYYLNHPTPETYPDTLDYLAATQHIMTSGKLVDPVRLPGYPLLITLVFLLAGQGNLAAVSIVQGGLFVVAVLEIYLITCLLTQRAWKGLLVGLLVASNTYLLTFIKPVLSEGFSLWIITTLALAIVLFIRTPRPRFFWLIAAFMLLAFMTRPEWMYAPVLFFPFLLLIAARQGRFRRLVPHVLAAALLLYGVLGLYIYGNATLNGFAGVSVVQRINLLGKVMQYNMQNETTPQYATLVQQINTYEQEDHTKSPYSFADLYPEVTANHWAIPNAYATSVVEQHPVEFVLKTVPIFFSSLTQQYHESQISAAGPFGKELAVLDTLSLQVVLLYLLFPLLAVIWLVWFCWPRLARSRQVDIMAALSLIGLYELVLIATGGYEAYARLHTAFNPLLLVVICESLLLLFPLSAWLLKRSPTLTSRLAALWPGIWWVGGGILAAGILASAILTTIKHGAATLEHLHLWSGFSLVVNAPLLSALVAGLLALLAYNVYQAHRRQETPFPLDRPEHTHAADSSAST
jgi:hypothetical protein